ncbi:WD repeat-containing protein 49 [Rhizophlyctis rosea]|uniref:WD repeat-containing protein 49 n=1 Tax=Rhizophlyctis rosea TaxID=64517 RepID=A0AAD5X9K6_9FUNG|nr:WD repeat-containing protein 49 [Rhizophlyctis rosea]
MLPRVQAWAPSASPEPQLVPPTDPTASADRDLSLPRISLNAAAISNASTVKLANPEGEADTASSIISLPDAAAKGGNSVVSDSEESLPKKKAGRTTNDVQQYMNISHFEQLMNTFQNHVNDDGSSGFDIDKFREVFGAVLGGNLSYDQLTSLFMKIDANSDGTVDWDEFSTYMMTGAMEGSVTVNIVFDERLRRQISPPHKDMIKRVEFIQKERKYISISREGLICLWTPNLRVQRVINTKDFIPGMAWVADAAFMHDQNKLVLITDDRQLCIYDVLSMKPRILAALIELENNPLSLAYAGRYDDDKDLILFGDDGGYVNVLTFTRKFFVDTAPESEANRHLTPAKLSKKDSFKKNNIAFYRRKMHNDWVHKVQYYQEMNAFVSCSTESTNSLIIGDLERTKQVRRVHAPKGINCFDFCRRPSFLVTGGRDKIVRLWNPYVLSKPAGSLYGHNTAIVNITVNHEEGHIITLSDDKVIKIWNARTLICLQTLMDKEPHRPENIISAIYFDLNNRQMITGSSKLEVWPLYRSFRHKFARSHDAPIVAAMFNESFHQVVSGGQNGSVCIWDLASGDKIFQFHSAHGKLEITAMCFDNTGRRLITGSRENVVKMWNFNNGQILRKMIKSTALETTDVIYIEMGSNRYIVATGWDRKIYIYIDDPDHFEAVPVRILNGAGSGAHRGHEDDISAVAFCPPSTLATSSVDGAIVVWNLESGHIRLTIREPFLALRSKEEKPVEKILFLYQGDRTYIRRHKIPLLSCHADGCMRLWDVYDGSMMHEFNCQAVEDEGLTTMSLNPEGTALLVGGSKGHVRLFDVRMSHLDNKRDWQSLCNLKLTWRAHVQSIVSASYVNRYDIIITASKDATIRVWIPDGTHVGVFGQDEPWILGDASTYMPLPEDVKLEAQMESERHKMITKHKELMKKNVIDKWKGLQEPHPEIIEPEPWDTAPDTGMSSADLSKITDLRGRAIKANVVKKWKDYYVQQKNAQDWTITPDLITVHNPKQFFSFDSTRRHRPRKPLTRVKYDAVYHMLNCYPLEEIPQFTKPAPKVKGLGGGGKMEASKVTGGTLPSMRKDKNMVVTSNKYGIV